MEDPPCHPYIFIKKWNAADLQEDEEIPDEELEVEGAYYEIEKFLRGGR